jgi:hypothetical protein
MKAKQEKVQVPVVAIGTTFDVGGEQVTVVKIEKKQVVLSNGDSVLFTDIEKAVSL